MNKLSKKFIAGITLILCLSCLLAIVFNTVFWKNIIFMKNNDPLFYLW